MLHPAVPFLFSPCSFHQRCLCAATWYETNRPSKRQGVSGRSRSVAYPHAGPLTADWSQVQFLLTCVAWWVPRYMVPGEALLCVFLGYPDMSAYTNHLHTVPYVCRVVQCVHALRFCKRRYGQPSTTITPFCAPQWIGTFVHSALLP